MLNKIDRPFDEMRQTQPQNNRNDRLDMNEFFHRIILRKNSKINQNRQLEIHRTLWRIVSRNSSGEQQFMKGAEIKNSAPMERYQYFKIEKKPALHSSPDRNDILF